MKGQIHTVLGKIESKNLGFTQCHEHLLLRKGTSFEINPALFMDNREWSEQEVMDYKKAGGCALVEAQPGGCGRDAEGLEKISRKTGVHIVASTGFHKLLFYPEKHWIRTVEERKLCEFYCKELTEGMYTDTDLKFFEKQQQGKAGIIKTALDKCNLQGQYAVLFRAAVRAQKETGAPLMVHIEAESDLNELLKFFKAERINMEKVYFCHMDRACAEESFWKVLETGAALEFDTIGRFKYHSDKEEIALIKRIFERGYERQLLCSLDTTRERLKTYTPEGVGLAYILKTFIPEMRKQGITEEQVQKIFRENPGRILAWE